MYFKKRVSSASEAEGLYFDKEIVEEQTEEKSQTYCVILIHRLPTNNNGKDTHAHLCTHMHILYVISDPIKNRCVICNGIIDVTLFAFYFDQFFTYKLKLEDN